MARRGRAIEGGERLHAAEETTDGRVCKAGSPRAFSVDPADRRFDRRDVEAEAAEGHPVAGAAAAGLERDPLLDRGALGEAVAQVEDVALTSPVTGPRASLIVPVTPLPPERVSRQARRRAGLPSSSTT